MCCMRLAGYAGPKKVAKNRYLGTIAQLRWAISSQLRHVSTIGKNMLSSNISSTCPHNMVNFSPLAAEIVSLVWGTRGNFNGFRVLAALLYSTLVVGVSQTLRRWTEGATYIQQGGHHSGHWPTFLVTSIFCVCNSVLMTKQWNLTRGYICHSKFFSRQSAIVPLYNTHSICGFAAPRVGSSDLGWYNVVNNHVSIDA